ncbi:MAG: response regulator, partial [Longimicrobiales bacterium]
MNEGVRGPLILVVDDVEEDRVYLSAILTKAGYEVRSVGDAEAGLKEARQGQPRPALVVMDVQLPGISGLEATRRLKMDPLTARMPVVVVSAHDLNRKESRDANYDAVLRKPVGEEDL